MTELQIFLTKENVISHHQFLIYIKFLICSQYFCLRTAKAEQITVILLKVECSLNLVY